MKKEIIGTGAILLATLFWGITFVLIKEAVSVLNVFNFIFWRFGIAAILLAIIFAKTLKKIDKRLIIHGSILGLFLAGTVIFQTIGLQFTKASNASFITGLSVVLVTIFISILNKKLPKVNTIIAVFLAIIGLGFVTLTTGLAINRGDLWVLLCAICFAWYIIFAGKYTHEHGSLQLTIVQIFLIALISGIIAIGTGNVSIPQGYKVWQAIIFCSIFASVIAFALQIHFQKYVKPTKTAIIFTTEPIFATITAILYVGEVISLKFVIGAVLIIIAMLLTEFKRKDKAIPTD